MIMLAERLFSYYSIPRKREDALEREPGLSISGMHLCPYIMYLTHKGEYYDGDNSPQQILNMDDGHDQEEQSVRRLAKAGIIIEDRQREVEVGVSRIKGHIDGTFKYQGKKYLWEHKAFNSNNFWQFSVFGLKYMPNYIAQFQVYLKALIDEGEEIEACDYFVKCKESNDYIDRVFSYNPKLANQIVEWADNIRAGWEPKPGKCVYCTFNDGIHIDFSWIGQSTDEDDIEQAEKWRKAQQLLLVGNMMDKEARQYFIKKHEMLYPDQKVVTWAGGIRTNKIVSNPNRIQKDLILEHFGVDGYLLVTRSKEEVSYRFTDLELKK